MTYDLICVGAGIANLSLAYKYLEKNKNKSVLIIDKGPDILKRFCPKVKTGKCVKCSPCRITTGFGGAGCFSDCKLTFSEEVGGTLIEYVGKEKFEKLQSDASYFFDYLGANAPLHSNSDYFEHFSRHCEENGLRLVKSEVKHLGTEGSYELMCILYDRLKKMGCEILCNTKVNYIDFDNKQVKVFDGGFKYDKLSIAVGRYGSEWLRGLCVHNHIQAEENTVDIGIRFETFKSVTNNVTNNMYEMKIVNQITDHSSVRTFCVNPGGYVVNEEYDNVSCVNGHSFMNTKSDNTNFALLYSVRFTEPFNNPIEYGKSICKLANMLGGGKVLVQRLGDLITNKRTNYERLHANSVIPTLKDAVPGDLRFALPYKAVDAILGTIEKLDKVIPGLWNHDNLLYAPEVKFYSSKIKLNSKLQVEGREDLKDVYFLGDSSGVTHGIIQACMSGIYVAENLI